MPSYFQQAPYANFRFLLLVSPSFQTAPLLRTQILKFPSGLITSVLPSSLLPSFSFLHSLRSSLLPVLHSDTHVHMVLTLFSHCSHTSLVSFSVFTTSPSPHAVLSFYPIAPLPLLEFQATGSVTSMISVKLGSRSLRVLSLFPWLSLHCPH